MIFEKIQDINVEEFRLKEWEEDEGDDQVHGDSDIESERDKHSDFGDESDREDTGEYDVPIDKGKRAKDTHGDNDDLPDHLIDTDDIDDGSDSDSGDSGAGGDRGGKRKHFKLGSKHKGRHFNPELIKKVFDIMGEVLKVFEMDHFDSKDIEDFFNGQKIFVDINMWEFIISKDRLSPVYVLKSWDDLFWEFNKFLDDPNHKVVETTINDVKICNSYDNKLHDVFVFQTLIYFLSILKNINFIPKLNKIINQSIVDGSFNEYIQPVFNNLTRDFELIQTEAEKQAMTMADIIERRDERIIYFKETKIVHATIIEQMIEKLETSQATVKNMIITMRPKEIIPNDIQNIYSLKNNLDPNNTINKQFIRQNNSGYHKVSNFTHKETIMARKMNRIQRLFFVWC